MNHLQEVFDEPDGTVVYLDGGKVLRTKTLKPMHRPSVRHYYVYQPDPKHPEGRTTLMHLQGAQCPPLPSP